MASLAAASEDTWKSGHPAVGLECNKARPSTEDKSADASATLAPIRASYRFQPG
jgi:hypothetical protein